jgi:hypothetical protein
MKISRFLLLAAVFASLLSAQTAEERTRFQDIQDRHKRGEQISDGDMEFAKGMMAKMRQQKGQGQGQAQAQRKAAWAKEHPPRDSTGLVPLPDLAKGCTRASKAAFTRAGRTCRRPRT